MFDDRPFVYYTVRPAKVVEGKAYATARPCLGNKQDVLYSGTFTITFSAHDPFGKMAYVSYDEYDTDGAERRCGIVSKTEMPPAVSASTGTHLVYNPGTEITDTVIRISGSAPKG